MCGDECGHYACQSACWYLHVRLGVFISLLVRTMKDASGPSVSESRWVRRQLPVRHRRGLVALSRVRFPAPAIHDCDVFSLVVCLVVHILARSKTEGFFV